MIRILIRKVIIMGNNFLEIHHCQLFFWSTLFANDTINSKLKHKRRSKVINKILNQLYYWSQKPFACLTRAQIFSFQRKSCIHLQSSEVKYHIENAFNFRNQQCTVKLRKYCNQW